MKIHRLILIAMLFITSYPLYSQTVRGKIVDADNQPLPCQRSITVITGFCICYRNGER